MDCRKGRIDVIVVHSLDRWSRNLRVTLETFKHPADHNVAFVSITENIDYSTPEGRLFIAMIGAFAQYFSDSLSKHSSKGMKQRAMSGLQNGDVPFRYRRCTDDCPAEHKGNVHLVPEEAEAVKGLFQYLRRWGMELVEAGILAQRSGLQDKEQTSPGERLMRPRRASIYSRG